MNTTHDTSLNTLTLAQELSQIISKIAAKELDFFADNNIEILHDLRVDLRKLRTWLKIIALNGYPLTKLYKHTTHCHTLGGELRNFDVLNHWIKTNPLLVSAKLHQTFKLKRKKSRKVFLKELTHQNLLQQLRVLGRNFLPHIKGITKSDFEPQVQLYIDKKRDEFNRILPKVSEDVEQLHKMRKILKKVRYALQLLPTIKQEHQDALKHLQDMLGYINDRRVWIELVQSHLKENEETTALKNMFNAEMKKKIEEFTEYISLEKVYF
ncbi:MAG: CHAD domain-containing protein [Sulfuricurvum sp.]|nr:CHAD domain-containing protein [Sulfuricurvum sp.]